MATAEVYDQAQKKAMGDCFIGCQKLQLQSQVRWLSEKGQKRDLCELHTCCILVFSADNPSDFRLSDSHIASFKDNCSDNCSDSRFMASTWSACSPSSLA